MSKTLIWEPPTTQRFATRWRAPAQAATPAVQEQPRGEWERAAIAVLERPIIGESAAAGHARKEAELKELFAALSVAESRALHARLSIPNADDQLARLIGRMVQDRRQRLIAFVADARRREAVAAAARARCA
jgi:hypothetical protein